MDEPQTQTQTVSVSKTKMAVAIGLLGLSALAAGFAGMRAGSFTPDLSVANIDATTEGDMNKFSVTIQNNGSATVSSPFMLHMQLGDEKNPIQTLKVMNPPSATVKGSYENLESKDGSFDILVKNYKLRRGQSTTITYWFVIPSKYESDALSFAYVLDSTNLVSESNEENNSYKRIIDIEKTGLLRENTSIVSDTPETTSNVSSTTAVAETTSNVSSTTAVPESTSVEPMPDLVIENFNITDGTYEGFKHFSVTIKNIGTASAVRSTDMHQNLGTFVVQMYFIKADGTVKVFNKYLSSTLNYANQKLDAGKTLTISQDLQLTGIDLNNYTQVKMKVDWLEGTVTSLAPFLYPEQGYILESNENNNVMTKDIRQ